jgi:hypothetical protein
VGCRINAQGRAARNAQVGARRSRLNSRGAGLKTCWTNTRSSRRLIRPSAAR